MTPTYFVVSWDGATVVRLRSELFGVQTWIRTTARREAKCAQTGFLIQRGDAIWRPSLAHATAANQKHRIHGKVLVYREEPRVCAGCGYMLHPDLRLCLRCGTSNDRLKRPA